MQNHPWEVSAWKHHLESKGVSLDNWVPGRQGPHGALRMVRQFLFLEHANQYYKTLEKQGVPVMKNWLS